MNRDDGIEPCDLNQIEVVCSYCMGKFSCPVSEVNGADLVFCTDECEDVYINPPSWRPDPHYRVGYDYACGYHD